MYIYLKNNTYILKSIISIYCSSWGISLNYIRNNWSAKKLFVIKKWIESAIVVITIWKEYSLQKLSTTKLSVRVKSKKHHDDQMKYDEHKSFWTKVNYWARTRSWILQRRRSRPFETQIKRGNEGEGGGGGIDGPKNRDSRQIRRRYKPFRSTRL